MSRFLSPATARLAPYVPGEQPQEGDFIKLNTNECPYPPAPGVAQTLAALEGAPLRLYPDPQSLELRQALAAHRGLRPEQVFAGNGSDEVLAFAFRAFCEAGSAVAFPDISYGFYAVYAQFFGLTAREVPLRQDFRLAVADYKEIDAPVVIANPNAPTGLAVRPAEIEGLLAANRDRLVIVDEAYVDFAPGQSCVPLIDRYDNLLVVQTFSKSRALAGLRIGFGLGDAALIAGLQRIQNSFNPYNLNRISQCAGCASLAGEAYWRETVAKIMATREQTRQELSALGFEVLPSEANFLFVRHPSWQGAKLAAALRSEGILVRQWEKPRIADYLRISIGSEPQMQTLIEKVRKLL